MRSLDAAILSKMDHDQGAFRRPLNPARQTWKIALPPTPNHAQPDARLISAKERPWMRSEFYIASNSLWIATIAQVSREQYATRSS